MRLTLGRITADLPISEQGHLIVILPSTTGWQVEGVVSFAVCGNLICLAVCGCSVNIRAKLVATF